MKTIFTTLMKSFIQWFTLSSRMTHAYTLLMFFYIIVPKVHTIRGDDYKIDQPRYFSAQATCIFKDDNGRLGRCQCPRFHSTLDDFECTCNDNNGNYVKQFLCECANRDNTTLSNCSCINLIKTLENLNCSLQSYNNNKETILLGMLIPYTFGKETTTSSYSSGKFYASAMFLAIDDVNKNKDLLPNHELKLVWADTECDWERTVRVQLDMMKDRNVDAFIGGGCAGCEAMAKNAGAENIPIISHMCTELSLSAKEDYPTFARTEPIGRHLTPAIEELLKAFKWEKFAMVVENSPMYNLAFKNIMDKFKDRVLATATMPAPAQYTYHEHFESARKDMAMIKDKGRIVILLMSVRVAKECLIAAADLEMINGDYVFLVFEIDITRGIERQTLTFKWATADYASATPTFSQFIKRSKKLCKAWEVTLLIMTKLPEKKLTINDTLQEFQKRVRLGMKSMFNETVYEGLIPTTNYSKSLAKPPAYAQNLYDAIMFYALTVNDTINKGQNYRDGKTIRVNMGNKVFASIHGYEMLFDTNGEVQHTFRLHHFGTEPDKCEFPFPKMEVIGELEVSQLETVSNETTVLGWKFTYKPLPDATEIMYWPNGRLEDVRDEPKCGFDGNKCKDVDDGEQDRL